MILGLDYLLGHHYQQAMLSAHPRGLCGGIFLRTSGNALSTVEAMCRRGTFSEIVVHLAPFDRSHTYPINRLISSILVDAKAVQAIQVKYPKTFILLSPFCEHNHKATDMQPVFVKLKQAAPSCGLVNSVWKGERVSGIPTEFHLPNMKSLPKIQDGDLISFDGFGGDGSGDFSDCDIQKIIARYPNARQIRGWDFACNGKYSHDDPTPLGDRDNFPTKEYLQGKHATMSPREGTISWDSKKGLYKAFSDDHDGNNPKDNKAMCIINIRGETLAVFDSKGKKIDAMQRVRPDYNDKNSPLYGFPRYYSKYYAFQIANIAYKNTGSYLIKIGTMPLTDGRLRSTPKI